MIADETDFASDLLRGAEEIADFLFGDRSERRKVYYLAATSRLPTFKLGSMISARRSSLMKWVEEQERRNNGNNIPPKSGNGSPPTTATMPTPPTESATCTRPKM
jgi:hypothetical protein